MINNRYMEDDLGGEVLLTCYIARMCLFKLRYIINTHCKFWLDGLDRVLKLGWYLAQ